MQEQSGVYLFDGNVYKSDVVRSMIRPYVNAMGKLVARHVRETLDEDGHIRLAVNPTPYVRLLLESPNPYMSGQTLQKMLATQLILNGNAFALVIRDANGLAAGIYPINAASVEAVYAPDGALSLRFYLRNGNAYVFDYDDVVHLRGDVSGGDLFGASLVPCLLPLMEVVSTTDRGLINAIKNSSVVRWLLKFSSSMRPEDMQRQANQFADSFLSTANGTGVAAVDAKAEAIQVSPHDYVPNAAQMDRTTLRMYATVNTNQRIVTSDYTEDQWTAYYEAQVEPDVRQLGDEMTRKLFSARARGFGNRIVYEATSLSTASMSSKLGLEAMVDRGALTPNEWRAALGLAPLPGGDEPIRRLDTQPVTAARTKAQPGEADEGKDHRGEVSGNGEDRR